MKKTIYNEVERVKKIVLFLEDFVNSDFREIKTKEELLYLFNFSNEAPECASIILDRYINEILKKNLKLNIFTTEIKSIMRECNKSHRTLHKVETSLLSSVNLKITDELIIDATDVNKESHIAVCYVFTEVR